MVIYMLWLRQIKRYFRSRARIVGSLGQPLLFLLSLGFGFGPIFRRAGQGNYIQFLAPGVIAMTVLFSGIFNGIELIWDRQFGFLKETLVAPVPRVTIMIGRTLGGATTSVMQGLIVVIACLIVGFRPSGVMAIAGGLVFMVLIAVMFTALGTAIASVLSDFQGFQMIMNFLVMPIFFLSGALFPLMGLPRALDLIARIDPLSYGVDGLRGSMTGMSHFGLPTDLAGPLGAHSRAPARRIAIVLENSGLIFGRSDLGFAIREEMSVDVLGDRGLILGAKSDEFEAHADALVAPRDLGLDVDVLLAHRHAEASLDRDALVERVGGAHGDAAAADVQRDSGGDRVAEAVRDRNAKNHARAGTPVEIAGEQMRGQRGQDVLQRGVLVDVAGDVQRRKLADLAGIRDRAAEDDNGRLLGIDVAKCAHEADAVGLWQTEIDHDQVNLGEIRFDARDELVAAGNGDGLVPRRFEHRLEAVAHECGVVRDDHRLGRDFRGLGLGRAHVLSIGFAVN